MGQDLDWLGPRRCLPEEPARDVRAGTRIPGVEGCVACPLAQILADGVRFPEYETLIIGQRGKLAHRIDCEKIRKLVLTLGKIDELVFDVLDVQVCDYCAHLADVRRRGEGIEIHGWCLSGSWSN